MHLIISLCFVIVFNQTRADSDFGTQVTVPPGNFVPFFKEANDRDIPIKSFSIDKYPVSNNAFNEFIGLNPKYAKSKIISLFADQRYLQHWTSDLLNEQAIKAIGLHPVTNVSWFVAKKYCQSKGKRLPTIAEWEYASDSANPAILEDLLAWYAKTGTVPLENIGQRKANKFGLHDMHGLIWEWVEDFSSVMISSDSRSKGDRTDGFFCGGGSVSSLDSKAYATFMRYGFRSGLRGDYCMQNLGFRCVSENEPERK